MAAAVSPAHGYYLEVQFRSLLLFLPRAGFQNKSLPKKKLKKNRLPGIIPSNLAEISFNQISGQISFVN
jgi:hypothetical protein